MSIEGHQMRMGGKREKERKKRVKKKRIGRNGIGEWSEKLSLLANFAAADLGWSWRFGGYWLVPGCRYAH